MTLAERLSEPATRGRKRGGAIVLAVVLLGALVIGWIVWQQGGDEAKLPSKEQITRPGGTKYLVTADPLRTSQGFEVITLTDADLEAQPLLDDLVRSGSHATLILTGTQLDALHDYLVTRLPEGWDDPFDYGVAWRYGNNLVHFETSEADVV